MPRRKARSDGRYQGRIQVGTVDGMAKYKYVYGKTPKEVEDKLAVLRVELGKGADLTAKKALSWWIDRWLVHEEQTQTPEWHKTVAFRAAYWRQKLGDADVTKITTAELEQALTDLAKKNPTNGKPSSKKTITEYRSVIRRIFAYIVQNRAVTFDPSLYIPAPKNAPKTARTAISDEQIAAIRTTPHEAQLPCLIMLYAGLRLGEVCALTWTDLDLSSATIRVNKSYNFKSGETKPPKTEAGNRTIPIPPQLAEVLAEAPRTALLVCPHNNGTYSASGWRNVMSAYCRTLGFEFTAHQLRHTCCTIYYEAGIDVLTAQRWMGHANASTTMRIYTHLRETKERSSVARLNDYLSTQSNSCAPTLP